MPHVYQFESFVLDSGRRLLLRDYTPQVLSPKVLDLLVALVENRDRVLSKDELLKHIWGDTVVEEGGLTRNISLLRKALGETPDDHRFIVTVPGLGYRFVADVHAKGTDGQARSAATAVSDDAAKSTERGVEPLTPDALDVEPPSILNTSRRRWPGRAAAVTLAAVVVISAAALFVRSTRTPASRSPITSIAVLPLNNVSGDPAQEYLAAGMADVLIAELGKVEGLRVIARGSVAKYRGAPDALVAARELGVQGVVAGTVQQTGTRISVSARLVDAATGTTMWSDSFGRDVKEVLALQREVTIAIAERVRARLPPSALARRARVVNPEAFDALLRARYLAVRTTDADTRAAITLLDHAIALDAEFAPAYGQLATVLVTRLAYVKPDETAELEQRAFAAVEKALALDPDVPEAYLARGDLLWSHSQRFAHERAVQEFRHALALHPNSDEAHRRLARVFVHLGFFDQALQHASIALAINPSNAQALNTRAQATLWSGHDDEALTILRNIPGPVLPELVEANTVFALLREGQRDEAAAELERARRTHPDDPSGNLPAMKALMVAGSDPRAAETLIRMVQDRKAVNPSHHAAYFAALAFAQMQEASEAVHWLREAADTGFPCYELFARDPLLNPIRKSPEFAAFMAEAQKRSAVLKHALFPDAM